MKEHPIPFSARMVQAILEDQKTQTRQPVTARNSIVGVGRVDWSLFDWKGESVYVETADWPSSPGPNHRAPLPFVDGPATGQYLHVPYNWAENGTVFRIRSRYQVGDHLWVKETTRMPYWASRLTLVVTGVRAQQVQDISAEDVLAEGCPPEPWYRVPGGPLKWFSTLWDRINGQRHPWRSNPWVWVREFERLT